MIKREDLDRFKEIDAGDGLSAYIDKINAEIEGEYYKLCNSIDKEVNRIAKIIYNHFGLSKFRPFDKAYFNSFIKNGNLISYDFEDDGLINQCRTVDQKRILDQFPAHWLVIDTKKINKELKDKYPIKDDIKIDPNISDKLAGIINSLSKKEIKQLKDYLNES